VTNKFIRIENDGADILNTNYWETEHAARGFYFLSANAGAFRLLVPDSQIAETAEWLSAREVIVSRGTWPDAGKSDALEILFEDYSESPYSIHLVSEQMDRMPLDTDRDRKGTPARWKFTAWSSKEKILELPCRYRIVKKLPCLKPWQPPLS
jgi:hypothetical protein